MPAADGSTLILVLDLAGVFVFALSGGMVATRSDLDVYGILFLCGAIGLAGGITRDVLLGDLPPASFQDFRYLIAVVAAAVVAFLAPPVLERLSRPIAVLDAAGLSLFCVIGAAKALTFDVGLMPAVLLGVISATGGGMLRDVLVTRVPLVLQAELYAIPAMLGAVTVTVGDAVGIPEAISVLAGAAICFSLRLVGMYFDIRLPKARRFGGRPR